MTNGPHDNKVRKPTFVEPRGATLSLKPFVICGLIVAVALVILLAWRCNAVSQERRDENYQTLYDIGYAYPWDVNLKISAMAGRTEYECYKIGMTQEECPQPTTDTARRVLATLMTNRTETNGPGQYGKLYSAELNAAINRLFYGLIERLQQNPCGPIEYGYVSDRTLNELQASGYIHKCGQGWAINSEWAELIVVEPPSQSGNLYSDELDAAIKRRLDELIERLQQNPCGPIEYEYVSNKILNELQANGYIHKCGPGWAINSEGAELIVVEPQSQSVPNPHRSKLRSSLHREHRLRPDAQVRADHPKGCGQLAAGEPHAMLASVPNPPC